uniref:Uncharacterized protein n=1 Tax=Parascaris univalens TaxID=6257 RepID=A0A915CII7_PARUN
VTVHGRYPWHSGAQMVHWETPMDFLLQLTTIQKLFQFIEKKPILQVIFVFFVVSFCSFDSCEFLIRMRNPFSACPIFSRTHSRKDMGTSLLSVNVACNSGTLKNFCHMACCPLTSYRHFFASGSQTTVDRVSSHFLSWIRHVLGTPISTIACFLSYDMMSLSSNNKSVTE